MSDQQRRDLGDDFQGEEGDDRQTTLSAPPALEPQPTGRRALRLTSILATLFLALLVILSSVPVVRNRAVGLVFPTPTPTLIPGTDLFYLLPNPPGTTILLDGRPLARVPLPGDRQPLRLARGRHHLEWHSAAFPFRPLQCTIAVPLRFSGDTCPIRSVRGLPASVVPAGSQGALGWVITLHDSFAALPSDQAGSLTDTIQAALNAQQSSAIVQVGEHYFAPPGGPPSSFPNTATQPLRATLHFAALVNVPFGTATEPCAFEPTIQPCRFPGQDCTQLCTWPKPVAPEGPAPEWIAAAFAQPLWDYTTLDGTVIAAYQREHGLNVDLALLRITWDGTHWHITPIIGHTPALPPADDLLCGPALDWLADGPLAYILDPSTAGDVTLQEASAATPVDGCVVRVAGPSLHLPTPALFLERFGVLLAANPAASSLVPVQQYPPADASEQALAQQLAARLGP